MTGSSLTRPGPDAAGGIDRYMETGPYWEGLQTGHLVLQMCRDTGRFQHFPRPLSLYTGSRNLGWQEVSGLGKLVAWTKPGQFAPDKWAEGPIVVQAFIDLDEKVRLLALLVGVGPESLLPGLRVRIGWEHSQIFERIPVFSLHY